jgi:hypothetical protein
MCTAHDLEPGRAVSTLEPGRAVSTLEPDRAVSTPAQEHENMRLHMMCQCMFQGILTNSYAQLCGHFHTHTPTPTHCLNIPSVPVFSAIRKATRAYSQQAVCSRCSCDFSDKWCPAYRRGASRLVCLCTEHAPAEMKFTQRPMMCKLSFVH